MTGYGRADVMGERVALSVEARALNHRYLDLTIRLPRPLAQFESEVRKLLQSEIQRGRVEVTASLRRREPGPGEVKVNQPLALAYVESLRKLASDCRLEAEIPVSVLLQCPGVLGVEESESVSAEEGWAVLAPAVGEALKALITQRENEGAALAHELGEILDTLEENLTTLTDRLQTGASVRHERLRERVKKLLDDLPLDEGRLAMEVALLADRADVTEELARLRAHTGQFRQSLHSRGPVGRSLDFLIQEMNREINTIGSKADDLSVTQAVIQAKGLLEKLREQVQNLE